MLDFVVQIFAEDIYKSFEHYQRAFGAKQTYIAKDDDGKPFHLTMDVMGVKFWLAAPLPEGNKVGNITMMCLNFKNEEDLRKAYDVLKEDGQAEELASYPWSPLSAYVTDKFCVNWCLALKK